MTVNYSSLTARYRPQTFAAVAGQDTIKAILSRAAAEDKIAPAYLFSGTRGVGKTTLARILAKALNCVRAPAPEPCNACERCRAITLGSSVDVVEIDGASNRGIDDVRRLKEAVGYAPLEGRYKVFIIDEAHMLSREAFNALLKTLEEPPARVTFILATTEAHKFPITIVSRRQHYVFKRLPEGELEAHLAKILQSESLPYKPAALRLLARRASGSVRDSMSLLGQVLALGGDNLRESDVRKVLGLAGQEVFIRLLAAIRGGHCLAITELSRELLDQGLDIGFFLRELAGVWRNLFMLRQAGPEAGQSLGLAEEEIKNLLEEAGRFDLAYIHACWQMTLEGQRRILTSLEPALALELLLLNLAMLPRLVSLERFSSQGRRQAEAVREQESPRPMPESSSRPESEGEEPSAEPAPVPSVSRDGATSAHAQAASARPHRSTPEARQVVENGASSEPVAAEPQDSPLPPGDADFASEAPASEADPMPQFPAQPPAEPPAPDIVQSSVLDWSAFLRYCAAKSGFNPSLLALLRSSEAEWGDHGLRLTPEDAFAAQRLAGKETCAEILDLLQEFHGQRPALEVLPPRRAVKKREDLEREARGDPGVKLLERTFNAGLLDFGLVNNKK